jgi:hypothetical protein
MRSGVLAVLAAAAALRMAAATITLPNFFQVRVSLR